MIKKLTRLGNSSALVVDRALMELMEIDADTSLKVTVEGKRLIVEALSDAERDCRVDETIKRTGLKNAEVYRRLAK